MHLRHSFPVVLSLAAAGALASALHAQTPAPALSGSGAAYAANGANAAVKLTEAQLETLLGPIALYPDALIAIILPASTSSSDIVLAARFLAANHDPLQIDNQVWDESVRSLARYPDVIKWLDENLAWTQQLGAVFTTQPAEVMQAVQRLRARARAAGNLIDTPQQKVITEGEVILIEPASPAVIYVPRYDPAFVYVTRPYGWTQPSLFFGIGFGVGSWLSYDCDWRSRTIVVGDWRHRPQNVWVRPAFPYRPPAPGVTVVVGRPWQPPVNRQPRAAGVVNAPGRPVVVVNPRPYYERPQRPNSDDSRRPDSNSNSRNRSETRPVNVNTVIVNAPPTVSPPPVVMPPATRVGNPTNTERNRERPTGNSTTTAPERTRAATPRDSRPAATTSIAPRTEAPRETRPESTRRDTGGGERTSRGTTTERTTPERRAPERTAPAAPAPAPAAPVTTRGVETSTEDPAR